MASFTKWLGAGLGWSFGGPIGAILGYIVGNTIDGFTQKDIQNFKQQSSTSNGTNSGDFEISLLILSAFVIKADGKIDQRELSFVREHFIKMYGAERAKNAFKLFKEIIKTEEASVRQVCLQIQRQMSHSGRLQLMHYLFALAKADNVIAVSELDMLHKIGHYLNINRNDIQSIRAMFENTSENAYKILEIEKSATDKEVKGAYRKMVKKHHPDKVKHLGDEHLKGAQEKFLKIQEAYETIKKERGL